MKLENILVPIIPWYVLGMSLVCQLIAGAFQACGRSLYNEKLSPSSLAVLVVDVPSTARPGRSLARMASIRRGQGEMHPARPCVTSICDEHPATATRLSIPWSERVHKMHNSTPYMCLVRVHTCMYPCNSCPHHCPAYPRPAIG